MDLCTGDGEDNAKIANRTAAFSPSVDKAIQPLALLTELPMLSTGHGDEERVSQSLP